MRKWMPIPPITVAVLGSTGMLGHAVVGALAQDPRFTVVPFCRANGFDALSSDFGWMRGDNEFDYVINCAGVIWQARNPSRQDTFFTNSVFPHRLSDKCRRSGARLIHVSTDCVFTGKEGNYTEGDPPDADDDYGFSKRLGEPEKAMVIRSSVIGRELATRRSFLEWAISSRGTRVNGYRNHVWNGVTTDEYARICADIMASGSFEEGVHHVHSPVPITKYALLQAINERFDLGLDIVPVDAPESVDRTLATIRPLCQQLSVPDIYTMVSRLRVEA